MKKVTSILPIKSFDDDRYVFMATLNGTVKKTPLSDFSRPRQTGIKAVQLDAGDYLIGSIITDGMQDILLLSSKGKCVRFNEKDVRSMGRTARTSHLNKRQGLLRPRRSSTASRTLRNRKPNGTAS